MRLEVELYDGLVLVCKGGPNSQYKYWGLTAVNILPFDIVQYWKWMPKFRKDLLPASSRTIILLALFTTV
jgi:hypothetical protein